MTGLAVFLIEAELSTVKPSIFLKSRNLVFSHVARVSDQLGTLQHAKVEASGHAFQVRSLSFG